jgi:hypothetical protein
MIDDIGIVVTSAIMLMLLTYSATCMASQATMNEERVNILLIKSTTFSV